MTRKDFELIAAAVKKTVSRFEDGDERANGGKYAEASGAMGVAHALADVLGSTNAAFDRARFLKACGQEW